MVSLPKPEIKSVLNNLNVHLEDELALYRRQLRGQSPPPSPRLKRASKKQLDLISIQAREIPPAEQQASAQPPRGPALPPPPPNPFLRQTEGQGPGSSDTDMVQPSGSGAALEAGTQDLLSADSSDTVTAAGDGQGLALHQASTAPDGYLASSEELLKNLSDESDVPQSTEPQEPYNPNRENKLLAPLKVGALLLLLVGCVGAGYAIVNPSVLDPVRALFPQNNDPVADGNGASVSEEGGPTGSGDPAYKPPGPDLSTREFVELDLESLSTLEVNQQAPIPSLGTAPTLPGANTTQLPAPSAQAPAAVAPNPTASPTPAAAAPAPAAPASSQAPDQATAPSTSTPSAAAPAATAPASGPTSPAPAATAVGRNYYVIADYTGDSSLTKAREVVSDAFVRNFNEGSRIQLGAFDNGESAQQLIQELQSRGLSGRLYGPTDE